MYYCCNFQGGECLVSKVLTLALTDFPDHKMEGDGQDELRFHIPALAGQSSASVF
jgi:hypothetical protein